MTIALSTATSFDKNCYMDSESADVFSTDTAENISTDRDCLPFPEMGMDFDCIDECQEEGVMEDA